MKRCLVLISGISSHAYGLEQICTQKHFYRKIVEKYGRNHIYEIDYQKIMDRHALLMKSILDPLRLMFSPDGWAAERHVNDELQKFNERYDEVDVLTHSQGSWMVLKANAHIHNAYIIASPIGWFAPIARTMVRMNVGTPKLIVDNLFYIYSTKDLVSKQPPEIKGKWSFHAKNIQVIDTKTIHDLRKYLIALSSRHPQIFN